MAKDLVKVTADFSTTLASKVAIGATTATLSSIVDDDGATIPNGFYGFTIDRKNTSKEYITATLTGTALSNIKTIARTTGDESAGFAKEHRKGAEVIISDFVAIKRIQDVLETGYASATTPSTDYQLATKKYVDDLALGGSTTVDRVTVVATCGEDVTAGQLLYLKVSDSKWWKCDADNATTIDNVILGIAQGAGSTNGLITGGVLIKGVDSNLAGLTANSLYYASNTAGGVSATTGTYTRIIGIATAADKLYFDPEFNKVYKNYAVDSVGSDSYAITLQSAFGAYYDGMEVTFKAGTANTGACSLNVNGLGAKTIKKDVSSDLATGDILQNQIVKVIYDGTNFQLVSKNSYILPVVQVFSFSSNFGDTTSQFDITNPSGTTARYTWDGTGTNPGITAITFPTGYRVHIFSLGFNTGNNGVFTITASGTNYFEITNAAVVAENNKTLVSNYILKVCPVTWTKPVGIKYIEVEAQGGGGGGGGYDSDSSSGVGGGGSGGGYAKKIITAASLGATETVTIGIGGIFGSSGSNPTSGANGGNTTFGAILTAYGGTGGIKGDSSLAPVIGGAATGGDINITGGSSISSNVGSNLLSIGGSSMFGFGGTCNDYSKQEPSGYGSGGNGGVEGGGGSSHGVSGIVIVREYY